MRRRTYEFLIPNCRLLISAVALLCASCSAPHSPGSTTFAAGVPLALATERAADIRDLRYQLAFSIPASQSEPIVASETIRFTLKDASRPQAIDFVDRTHTALSNVSVNGRAFQVPVVDDHIVIPPERLVAGENVVEIGFVASDAPLNRNPEFLYTIFVPARAHEAFPCFDQPDMKARFALELVMPTDWQAVANGAEISREAAGDRLRIRFAETQPISTYLFAFAAGKFQIETAQRDGRTFRMFHRETDAAKVARNRDAIFDLHASSLKWLEDYTSIPYPFGKFDFVAVPSFQFGGMEHPGAIFYNASGILLDESATENQYLNRANVIAHETSHMWFGDLVTMRWFNDVWMKEVFANFMAAKIVNPSFPAINHDLRFLLAHYPRAYDVDRTAGTNAIRQPLENLKDAGTLYGAIIYQKAPIVMRQLEMLLGADALRDGLREYLRRYSFGNATWADLIAILDKRTPTDLVEWSRVWVEEPGRPAIRTDLAVKDGKIAQLSFRQAPEHRELQSRPSLWPQQLRVALGYADSIRELTVDLNAASADLPAAVGLPAPLYVLPTGGGWAYGAFALDKTSVTYLTTQLPAIPDALTRGAAWVTMWDALLDRQVSPAAFVELATAALPRESDEQLTSRVLGYLGGAWWR